MIQRVDGDELISVGKLVLPFIIPDEPDDVSIEFKGTFTEAIVSGEGT